MNTTIKLPFFTLLLLISFASVNAVLFTPALPSIAHFFTISDNTAQQTITTFLIGYALGQLLYGPLANRFGRKPALMAGIGLQIVSSLICVLAGLTHQFWFLVSGRFLLALGSGVGLKMTFTLVNECYLPQQASQKMAYLMLAFAITPGLATALGGVLNTHYGWLSCFYAEAVYGIILLILVTRLPETKTVVDRDALKISHLLSNYLHQFKNLPLISAGLLMGLASCFIYIFAALAPFIAMNLLGMSSSAFGTASILPTMGLLLGSLFSAQFCKKYSNQVAIILGICITLVATILMLVAAWLTLSPMLVLFLPMIGSYFGLSLVFPNASALAMGATKDKAHGSAVMNFLNMGLVTVVVLSLSQFIPTMNLLPIIYLLITFAMIGFYYLFKIALAMKM
jgi:MFS family permease